MVAGFIGLASLSTPFLGASAAHASDEDASTVTWMVRPSDGAGEDGRSWIELELDPGQTVEEHLLVRNLSARDITFRLSAADGYFTETGRFNMLTSDKPSVDAGTWIRIQDTVDVPSGGDAIVPFTVTVPDNATPGDHPAGVAAAIRSGEDEQIGVESRVGFRVMTRVTGDLAPSAEARIGGAYRGSWNPFEPGAIEAQYSFTNTGNTRLSLTPDVAVTALFGLVRFSMPGEPIAEMAPGESRTGTVQFDAAWPLFAYTAEVTAPAAVIVTGTDAAADLAPIEASGAVGAIPWSQLVTALFALLIIWALWRDRRRRDRRLHDMLEQAREEGRQGRASMTETVDDVAPPTDDAPLRRRRDVRASASFAALALVAVLGLNAAPALADTLDPDPASVGVRVEVTPVASPSPVPGDSAALPSTGGGAAAALVWVGGAVTVAGALLLTARRRAGVRSG